MRRRRFLLAVGATGGAALLGCSSDEPGTATSAGDTTSSDVGAADLDATDTSGSDVDDDAPTPDGPPAKSVIILGAGLAGLAAALKLDAQGYAVTVLEGQAEVGGRVKTRREGFADGLWAEVGAIRVPDVHFLTQKYMASHKVALVSYPPGASLNVIKDLRFVREEGDPWPDGLTLTELERTKGFARVQEDYIRKYFQQIGDPKAADWPSQTLIDGFDDTTFVAFLKAQGASDDFIAMYRADNGTEVDIANTLALLATFTVDKNWNQTYTADGGLDQLPKAMAAKLDGKIRFGHAISKVAMGDDRVTVTAIGPGGEVALIAERVICTLPPPRVRKLTFEPPLAPAKEGAYTAAKMMPASRLYLQTKTAFWKDETFNGDKTIGGLKLVRTDTPIERVWDVGAVMKGSAGLLMAYMQHDNATAFAAVPDADRPTYVLGHAKAALPTLETEYDGVTWNKAWQDDPWAEGGWYSPEPGEIGQRAAMMVAEGRIHFAGEHTSVWNGWMQGALESGERAAAEVASADGQTASAAMSVRDVVRFAVARLFS